MPMPQLPSSINAAKWKTAAKDVDHADVFAAIGKVAKAHMAVEPKAFAGAKPKSLDDAEGVRELLDKQSTLVSDAGDAVKALAKASDTLQGSLKGEKDKAKAKANGEIAKMLAGIVGDAESYFKDLKKAYDDASTSIDAAIEALAAKEDAEAEGEEGGDDLLEKMLARVQGVLLRDLPKYVPKPNQPSIFRFFVAWAKGDALLLAGKTKVGPKQIEMVKQRWGAAFAPSNVTNGDLSFDSATQTWIFSCRGKLPPKNLLVVALKKPKAEGGVGKAIKFKLQKLVKGKDGQEKFEDATSQDEVVADGDVAQTTEGVEAQQRADALLAKLDGLKSKFDARVKVGGNDASNLKLLDASIRRKALGDPVKAQAAYEALVALLGAAPTADAPLPLPSFRPAVTAWLEVRKRYESEVKALAGSLDSVYREELATNDPQVKKAIADAKGKLTQTAGLIGPQVEQALGLVLQAKQRKPQRDAAAKAKAEVDALSRKLLGDKVFLSLEGKNNELKPDMKIVTDVTQTLKSVRDAMADALKI